jgi:hypothetical protein
MDTFIPPRIPVAVVPRPCAFSCRRVGQNEAMATIPESTKTSLHQRLTARARERWPRIERINLRFRTGFAYVDAVVAEGETLRLCRLRYTGYANEWGFAIYRASHGDYEDSFLSTGLPFGPAEDALDTASGLYLADPTAWT